MSLHKPFFVVKPTDEKDVFRVEHNCNGALNFRATDDVGEKTARLLELALLEGQRRMGRALNEMLTTGVVK